MTEAEKNKQLTLRLPESIHREFKVSVAKEGRTMGEVALELIQAYLKKHY